MEENACDTRATPSTSRWTCCDRGRAGQKPKSESERPPADRRLTLVAPPKTPRLFVPQERRVGPQLVRPGLAEGQFGPLGGAR